MDRYKITLRGRKHLTADYYAFHFDKPEGLTFEEGQYGVFLIDDRPVEGRNLRAFSFASSQHESNLMIATKIVNEPSDYKRQLLEMEDGAEMTVAGPTGRFTLEPDHDAVFIAGGIGITPIRSMLMTRHVHDYNTKHVLIYSELNEAYPFADELNELKGVDIHYTSGVEPTRNQIEAVAAAHMNEAYYYLAGSPGFVSGIQDQLVLLGIQPDRIKYDRFTGY